MGYEKNAYPITLTKVFALNHNKVRDDDRLLNKEQVLACSEGSENLKLLRGLEGMVCNDRR